MVPRNARLLLCVLLNLGVSSLSHAGLFDGLGATIIKSAMGSSESGKAADTTVNVPPGEIAIDVVGLESLPKNKKIILGNFVVEFQSRYEKTSSGTTLFGLGSAGSSTVTNDITLPDQNTLQTITNFVYLDLVKKLKNKGYEVIEVTSLSPAAKAAYDEIQTSPSAVNDREVFTNFDGQSVLYSPDGMRSALPTEGCDHYKKGWDISRGISIQRTAARENKMAIAQGNVPVLKVWMTVGFGDVDAKGGNANINSLTTRQQRYGSSTADLKTGNTAAATAGMYLKPGVSRFSLLLPSENKFEYTTPHCNSGWRNKSSYRPPADGDVLIQLTNKYRDDGMEVVALSNEANTIGITDTALGGGVGIRTVKENSDGTQAQSRGNSQGTQVKLVGSSSSGRLLGNADAGTAINTTSQYVSEIRADNYAASAVKIIVDVTTALAGKL